jgi:hypothetical protein
MRPTTISLLLASIVAGCSTGIFPAGPDTYMLSRDVTGFESVGVVKGKLYQQAADWCQKRGLVMVPISSDSREPRIGRGVGSVELYFRALKPGDPDIKRVNPEKPDTTQRIEVR